MSSLPFNRQVQEAVRFLKGRVKEKPSIALILGSGLGGFADVLDADTIIDAAEIPHYPVTSVQGHSGSLVFGRVREADRSSPPLLVFKGRVHLYEVNDLQKVIMSTAIAAGLGAKKLLVTNAAGGINKRFCAGDLMLIRDILNFSQEDIPRVGTAKPIASGTLSRVRRSEGEIFDHQLMQVMRDAAASCSIRLREGTYCWVKGPSYETAAEIQMFKQFGADAVGMSTVPEIVTASRLGLKIAGISLISNLATGISDTKLSHEEVNETANRVKSSFTMLMKQTVLNMES